MATGASSLLSWVKTEIDFSLKVVREALAKVDGDPREARALHICPHQLHQVSGALRMVGLEGARQFCTAIEGVVDGMVRNGPTAKSVGVANRALNALQEFTDNVADGGANVPLKLYPIYRELAAQLGRSDTSEKELFFPDLAVATPEHPAKQTMTQDEIRECAKTQRSRFQRGLVAWIHKPDDPRGLREMAQALDALDRVSSQLPEPRSLWWLSGALIDGLLHPPTPQWLANARTLCSRIDFQMRDLARLPASLNEQLARDLLYVLAGCPPSTDRLREAKERYALDMLLPEPEVGLEFDMDWLQPALADMRSRLDTAKNAWVEYLAGEPERLARFRELAKALKARADELGNHQLVRLFDVVVVVSTRLPDPYPAASQLVMLEMATAFLLAESIIDTFTVPPVDLEQQVVLVNGWLLDAAAGKSSDTPPEGLRSDLVQQFNQTQLRAQVAREILANLQHVEEVLDAYARDPAKRTMLPGLRPGLRQIHGALMVLGFTDATELLVRCDALIAECAAGTEADPASHMDWIAEGLSTLGLFLEPCLRGRPPETGVVEAFLGRLAQRAAPTLTVATDAAATEQPTLKIVGDPAEPGEARADVELTITIAPTAPAPPPATEAPAAQAAPDARGMVTPPGLPSPTAAAAATEVSEEMLDVYLEEAEEVLATVAEAMERCRENPDDRQSLTVIRRGFHTLKGSGRMVGLHDLGEIAWVIEQVMNRWLEQRREAAPRLLGLISEAHAAFDGWVGTLKARRPLEIDAERLLAEAAALKRGEEAPPSAAPAAEPSTEPETAASEQVYLPPIDFDVQVPAADTADEQTWPELPRPDFDAGPQAPEEQLQPEAGSATSAQRAPGGETPPVEVAPDEAAAVPEADERGVTVGAVQVPAGLYEIYLAEAQQHLATLAGFSARWSAHPGTEAPADCARAAHTLAGISRTAGFERVAELAAAMEHWLPHAAHASEPANAAIVKGAVEALTGMLRSIERHEEPAPDPELAAALRDLAARTSAPAPAPAAEHGAHDRRAIEDDIDPQLLPLFLEEARELLPLVGAGLRDWKARPADPRIAPSLKRTLHTLKGSARMAGAMRLGELAHLMESRIESAEAGRQATPDLVTELETQLDRLSFGVDRLAGIPAREPTAEESQATPYAPAPAPAARPGGGAKERTLAGVPGAMLRINADTLDRLINEAGESSIARSRIEGEVRSIKSSVGELSDSVLRLRDQLREMELQADSQMQSRLSELEEVREDFDPLEFDRYTRLQELARMMAETMHDIMSIHQTLTRTVDEADAALLHQGRINRDLQQELMGLRTVPFSSMAERLHRVVRQAARESEKKAQLDIRGEQVQLDRSVLERISAPLEHLLRNAVAHGVEPPQERVADGKPETGAVTLTLRQENDAVVLVLQDDGRGLDLEKLRQRGLEKGLIAPGSQPTAAEIAQLVFASGLSTADTVTTLAGRGIGMDVVRSEISAAGGRIEIDTAPGAGTTFTIYLPLTLAVAQAVLLRGGEQLYAVSAASVVQVMRVKPAALAALYAKGSLEDHGHVYRLHYLGHLLGTVEQAPVPEGYSTVLLLRSGNLRAALHVDELIRNQEIVIKNIGPQLAGTAWIAGATVLGDGRVVLILNAVQLAQRAEAAARTSPTIAPVTPPPIVRTVMVVDDSLTVRKITGRLLEREGYRVVVAKDGVDALEQVNRGVPDIMLVDLEMPRMDGFDLTRNLRADPRTAALPIVIISSRTADKHRARAFELGVNEFIGKPFQESELLGQIQKYLASPAAVH